MGWALAGIVATGVAAFVAWRWPRPAPQPGPVWTVTRGDGDSFDLTNIGPTPAVDVEIALDPPHAIARRIGPKGTVAPGARVTFLAVATLQYGMPRVVVMWGPPRKRQTWESDLPRR